MKNNIVVFDGVCNLCNWAVRFIIERDPNGIFSFASAQSETGQEILSRFKVNTPEPESVFLLRDEELIEKSSAALAIATELDSFWRFFSVLRFFPRPIRDWVYDRVAKNRYRLFGKRDVCMMPAEGIKERFLDDSPST